MDCTLYNNIRNSQSCETYDTNGKKLESTSVVLIF